MSWVDAPITIQGKDADLYVEQVGKLDAPVVYYLHGGPGYGSFSFRDLMGDDLTEFRMVYADQRGGGRSYAGEAFSTDHLAKDVVMTLDALRIEEATLLAHGFGAIPAVRAALVAPERIQRIVLVNPWFSMPLLARTLHRRAALLAGEPEALLPPETALADAESLDPEELVEEAFRRIAPKQLFDALEFPDPSSRLRLEHSDAIAQFGPQRNEAPEDMWTVSVLQELPGLSADVVALFGTQDGTSYPDQAEAGLAQLPQTQTGLMDAGHYPWLDEPEGFIRLVREALS